MRTNRARGDKGSVYRTVDWSAPVVAALSWGSLGIASVTAIKRAESVSKDAARFVADPHPPTHRLR